MTASRQAIKSRIASVRSTKKITNAMQMVASAKLTKVRRHMERNREYSDSLQKLLGLVLLNADASNPLLKPNPDKPAFLFVITSDMGLCGGYNANVFRLLREIYRPEDKIVMIGTHGVWYANSHHIKLYARLTDVDEEDAYKELSRVVDDALRQYNEGEIGSIKVLYTHYVNTLTFEPVVQTLLPPEVEQDTPESKVSAETLFEPDRDKMLPELIPMISKSVLYSKYMESKTSEQASRRMAMESATDNADELEDNLNLEYNRVRQTAITQEITEIVGGANALK